MVPVLVVVEDVEQIVHSDAAVHVQAAALETVMDLKNVVHVPIPVKVDVMEDVMDRALVAVEADALDVEEVVLVAALETVMDRVVTIVVENAQKLVLEHVMEPRNQYALHVMVVVLAHATRHVPEHVPHHVLMIV